MDRPKEPISGPGISFQLGPKPLQVLAASLTPRSPGSPAAGCAPRSPQHPILPSPTLCFAFLHASYHPYQLLISPAALCTSVQTSPFSTPAARRLQQMRQQFLAHAVLCKSSCCGFHSCGCVCPILNTPTASGISQDIICTAVLLYMYLYEVEKVVYIYPQQLLRNTKWKPDTELETPVS